MVGEKVLIPWYRYPPFSRSGIGGLSVAVWDLAHVLARKGKEVEVVVPLGELAGGTPEDDVVISATKLGSRLRNGENLTPDDVSSIIHADRVLSVANYASESLFSAKTLAGKIRRQMHMVAHGRPLSTYVPLRATPMDYGRMWVLRRREQVAESRLKGVGTLCVSRFVQDLAQKQGVVLPERTVVVPNGVDLKEFSPMNVERKYDLLFVGRFQKVKGLDILLDALPMIETPIATKLTLAIVGPFTEAQREFLLSGVPERLRKSIFFLGVVQRKEMPKVINSAGILVQPSRYESFGLPVLEAISCGKKVVASDVGAMRELVSGEAGLLCTPESVQLARSISSVLTEDVSDPGKRGGRETAQRYSWDLVADQACRYIFDEWPS